MLQDVLQDVSARGKKTRRNESWRGNDRDLPSPSGSFQGFGSLFSGDDQRSSKGFRPLGGSSKGESSRASSRKFITSSMHGPRRSSSIKGGLLGRQGSESSGRQQSSSTKLSVSFCTEDGDSMNALDSGSMPQYFGPSKRLSQRGDHPRPPFTPILSAHERPASVTTTQLIPLSGDPRYTA